MKLEGDGVNFHPRNEYADIRELIRLSLKEVSGMCDRHWHRADGSVLRASIPAQWDDTDVILTDTLRRAMLYVEKTTADEAAYTEKVELVGDKRALEEAVRQRDEKLKEANEIIKECTKLLVRHRGSETLFDPHERALVIRVKRWLKNYCV